MAELGALFARIKSPPMQPRAHALALLAAATCLLPLLLQLPPQLGIGFGIRATLGLYRTFRRHPGGCGHPLRGGTFDIGCAAGCHSRHRHAVFSGATHGNGFRGHKHQIALLDLQAV